MALDAQQQPNKDTTGDQQQPGQKSRYGASKRFSSDIAAPADWEKVPESVQAAVHRVHREMEEGISALSDRKYDEVLKQID
jgi:hypothetical protein